MSDNTQPASSRRALREKRRAEMEAMLASSKAEQEAKKLADQQATEKKDVKPSAGASPADPKTAAPSDSKPSAKPEVKTPPAKAPAKPASVKAPVGKISSGVPDKSSTEAKKPAGKPAVAPKAGPAPKQATESKTVPSAPKPAVKPAVKPADSAVKPASAPKTESAAKPDESSDKPMGERASLRRARDREALRERRRLEEEVGALTTNVPTVEPAEEPKPLTRRQLRLQSLADQNPDSANQKPKAAKPASKPKSTDDSPETTVMSVEEALAARRSHDPKTPVDPNLLNEDDGEIDLEVLAHQREMAARAAIISRRAAERERLRIENAKKGKEQPLSDPFTGALGNIREVEDRIAKTGVQGPKTESVSLDLDSSGKLSDKLKHNSQASKKPSVGKMPPKPAAKTVKPVVKPASTVSPAKPAPAAAKPQAVPAPKPATGQAVKPAAKPQVKTAGSNDQSTAQASAPQANVEMPRIEAVNAQGLQPLDAQTHGVRRANNMLIAMIAALSVGGAALIAGIVMLISSLSS
ncbi:hypothetical protein [Glutamicibacter ardleyensis]|uniref:Uncharacterized protein n=1 Tax=Glutamicibacter ardleyensis TaxID=225894 RepID=A0ABQ2DVJ5_9MICC|nr:hypothetical protein [Glutamicibacter ardleyensis]GGJ73909.1 hypothetical protein GCM10007173_36040 [Glutamicibacter ardleyensis]